jgi:hypothetical protein
MIRTKRKFYALTLNVLATLALGEIAGFAITQTAQAAPQVPLTATPEAAKADVDYWCSRSGFEQDCEAAKKHLKVVTDAVNERKNQAKVKESNPQSQDAAKNQSLQNDSAKHSSSVANNDENRNALKQLRAEYLELYQKNQDLKKARSALESKNSALNRKNRELKNQASQSCSVASQASNTVKSAIRPDSVPVSSELSGLGDSGASAAGEAAK